MHEISPFLKILLVDMPPNPPSKGSQLRSGMYIQNPRNFKVGPPPPREILHTPLDVQYRSQINLKHEHVLIVYTFDNNYINCYYSVLYNNAIFIRSFTIGCTIFSCSTLGSEQRIFTDGYFKNIVLMFVFGL